MTSAASADFISVDLRTKGDGLLTIDTQSHLVWLDLTETQGLTYDQAGSYPGFRYARENEVRRLFSDASIPTPTQFNEFLDFAFGPANTFINFFGQTGLIGFPSDRESAALFEFAFGGPLNVLLFEVQAGPLGGTQPIGRIRQVVEGKFYATGGFGTFLVHAPEPAPFYLLISAVLPVAFVRALRRAKNGRTQSRDLPSS
jgi:hypothetical protein